MAPHLNRLKAACSHIFSTLLLAVSFKRRAPRRSLPPTLVGPGYFSSRYRLDPSKTTIITLAWRVGRLSLRTLVRG